jgi:hypothetical protein
MSATRIIMTNGLACRIIKEIYSTDFSAIDKKAAIKYAVNMATMNGITKNDLINAIRWIYGLPEKEFPSTQKKEKE